jgi:hypothetical protein
MPKLNTKENSRIVHNIFGLRIVDAIQVVGISAQKYQWLVIKNSWSFKLSKDYLANRKFEEDTLCPGLCGLGYSLIR